MTVIELIQQMRHCSKSESKRLISQGAVYWQPEFENTKSTWIKIQEDMRICVPGVLKVGRNFLRLMGRKMYRYENKGITIKFA